MYQLPTPTDPREAHLTERPTTNTQARPGSSGNLEPRQSYQVRRQEGV